MGVGGVGEWVGVSGGGGGLFNTPPGAFPEVLLNSSPLPNLHTTSWVCDTEV